MWEIYGNNYEKKKVGHTEQIERFLKEYNRGKEYEKNAELEIMKIAQKK